MKNLSLNNPFTWLVGILAALAIAASGNIDPPSEIDAARDVAADVAQVSAAIDARPDLIDALEATTPGTEPYRAAVADLCQHTRGHDAQLLTLPDGTLVCRRAKAKVQVAQGGSL